MALFHIMKGLMKPIFYCSLLLLSLTGCEAPLNIDQVEESRHQAFHRSDVFQAVAKSPDQIVVVGAFGAILSSNDDGITWTRTEAVKKVDGIGQKPNFIDVTVCPDKTFYALSIEGDVWVAKDLTKPWNARRIDSPEVQQAMTCAPDGKLWVVGAFGSILESSDQGKSWVSHSLEDDRILTAVEFFDSSTGIITGEFGTVLTTVDGGGNWLEKPVIQADFMPLATDFIDPDNGWVVGLGGVVYHTSDAGETWAKEQNAVKAPLYGISATADGVHAVGESGVVLSRQPTLSGEKGDWSPAGFGERINTFLRIVKPMENGKFLLGGGGGFLQLVKVENNKENDEG